jgi:hypothetical protein
MAASSLPLLSDNIASLLDDVAAMTEVAAHQGAAAADDVGTTTQQATKKTAGVLGDDLALHAQQVTGVKAGRELPVVCAVAKGSLRSKAILVPAALGSSAVAPCATGHCSCSAVCSFASKVLKNSCMFFHSKKEAVSKGVASLQAMANKRVDVLALEQQKVKSAIRSNFSFLAGITFITLATAATASVERQLSVLVGISLLMTAGVYSLVAGSVKPDDTGRSGA